MQLVISKAELNIGLIPKHKHKATLLILLKVWKARGKKGSNLSGHLKHSEVNLILTQTQSTLIAALIHQLSSHTSILSTVREKLWVLILTFSKEKKH
jgi:hypothetical protein